MDKLVDLMTSRTHTHLSGGAWCSCCPRAYGRTVPDRPRHSCASSGMASDDEAAAGAEAAPETEAAAEADSEAMAAEEAAVVTSAAEDEEGSEEARS